MIGGKKMSYRWGFVGAGRIIPRFMEGIKLAKDAIPAAIYARNKAKGQVMAEKYSIEQVFDDFDEFIKKSKIDIAYIALPHPFHLEFVNKCLSAKIPTFCEKPMGPNADHEAKMIQCAKENGVFFAEAMWSRFFPIYRQVGEWITGGKIGDLVGMSGVFALKTPDQDGDRLFEPAQAGGVLLDLGIYLISFADVVFRRPPQDVAALCNISRHGTDDCSGIVFKYDKGEIATLLVSFKSNAKNVVTIYGTDGMIELFENFWKPRSAKLTCKDGIIDFNCPELEDVSVYGTDNVSFRGEGFQFEIEHVHECLRKGLKESPVIPLDKSLELMKTCDNIRSKLGIKYPFE
jgi:predicted dehydrogenase